MTSISDTEVVNAPGGLVELVQTSKTANVGVDVTTSANAVNVIGPITAVCDGSPVLVEFNSPSAYPTMAAAGGQLMIGLYIDGVKVNEFWGFLQAPTNTQAMRTPISLKYRHIPTVGSHTYEVKAYGNNTGGNIEASASSTSFSPMIFRVSKILQASQLLVTQANAPVVTQLPVNPVQNQEVYLYSTYGYTKQRYIGAAWEILEDNRKVYFQAHTNAVLGTTGGATMAFNRTIINQGNCFNTSTYLFTAPFAGDYKFRVQAQKRYTGIMQMLWLINGSTTNNRGVYIDIGNDSPGPNMEVMLSLSTGNTVGVHYTLSAGDVYGSPQEYFTYFQGEYLK